MATSIPHLATRGAAQQLIVHDEPLLMLAGEVQNSQFSSARYMQPVWKKLKAANLNTVFGSVAWEQVEPTEGHFDFSEVEQIILDARANELHIVLLWFGSFKNGLSTYAPSWVKRNAKRFPRAQLDDANGKRRVGDVLSIFGSEAQVADAKAFAALMAHIKKVDEKHSTVVMVQVENEVGLLGDSRDRSLIAEKRWNEPIPDELVQVLLQTEKLHKDIKKVFPRLPTLHVGKAITWSEFPGKRIYVEELFMAYNYSLYVNQVAKAGKEVYPLPLYTNVWQNYGDDSRDQDTAGVVAGGGMPGDYPCGGGVSRTLDIWQAFAPALDFIAPDIYLNDYLITCAAYRHNQALLVPEQRRDEYGARRVWSAFGSYQCIGTAPFGIDTLTLDENPFRKHYELLAQVSPLVLEAQTQAGKSIGFFFDELRPDGSDPSPVIVTTFGKWKVTIERSFVFGKPSAGSGMVIQKSEDEFLLIGWGFQVRYESTDARAVFTGLLRFEEQEIVNAKRGELRTLRILNGDETQSGKQAIMPSENPDYGGFVVCVTIPANTGIAICEPYALLEDDVDS